MAGPLLRLKWGSSRFGFDVEGVCSGVEEGDGGGGEACGHCECKD